MHTNPIAWPIIAIMIGVSLFLVGTLIGIFRLKGTDVVIRCTSCNQPVVLPWDEGTQNFDITPLTTWAFSRDLGWRCATCGDGPPQRYPDLYPQAPLPTDDIH